MFGGLFPPLPRAWFWPCDRSAVRCEACPASSLDLAFVVALLFLLEATRVQSDVSCPLFAPVCLVLVAAPFSLDVPVAPLLETPRSFLLLPVGDSLLDGRAGRRGSTSPGPFLFTFPFFFLFWASGFDLEVFPGPTVPITGAAFPFSGAFCPVSPSSLKTAIITPLSSEAVWFPRSSRGCCGKGLGSFSSSLLETPCNDGL